MADVKACRICLVMDVPLLNLQDTFLGHHLHTILGTLVSTDLPPYVCSICAYLIRKYTAFRNRCMLGQTLLYNILQRDGKITENSINSINKTPISLNLSVRKPSDQSFVEFFHPKTEEPAVKCEPFDNLDEDQEIFAVIKDDHDYIDIEIPGCTTSDDELLSLHQKYKKEGSRKRVKHRKTEAEDDTEGENTAEPFEDHTTAETAITHRKRRKPKKAEDSSTPKIRKTENTGGVEFASQDLTDFVTVISFTLEEQKAEIEKRKTTKNYLNSTYKCNYCYKGFIDTRTFNHHAAKHEPSAGSELCTVCKMRFKSRRALLKHVTSHEKQYQCKICPFVSKTMLQAQQHHRWHLGITYKCQYCKDVFSKWTSYLSHVRIKHRSGHVCRTCGHSFVSELGMNMHRSQMHKQENPPEQTSQESEADLYCAECEVKFENPEAWKRHFLTSAKHNNNGETLGCIVCGTTFTTAEELRHHRKLHPKTKRQIRPQSLQDRDYPMNCQHCDKVMPSPSEHWAHYRREHRDKNYPVPKDHICDVCGKGFRGNALLVYHKRTHSEERNFKCAQCPKAFHNKMNLTMHEKNAHSDNRPYPCSVCAKTFKSKGALDRHFRSHTGEKPYECEVCGKAFSQANSRKLHVRTVHRKEPSPYPKTRHRPKANTADVDNVFEYQ